MADLMARAISYDALHDYLEEHESDAHVIAQEYEVQGDVEDAARFHGRAGAFRDMLAHIEAGVVWSHG